MKQPVKYKERTPINSLTGIKSSLGNLRSVVSLTYLLYLANGRKSNISYTSFDGKEIHLKDEYKTFILNYLNDNNLGKVISENPLFKSQIESLYVGITLMFGLGRISFENKSLGMTKERTGGIRYPKIIEFASNIMLLDIILQGFNDSERQDFLVSWLKNEKLSNDIEIRVATFLNITIENNLFKLRDSGNDLYFQTEGIYLAFREDNEVSLETDEIVGPARILNSMLREELIPWFTLKNSIIKLNNDCQFDLQSYTKILSTSLDIKDIKVDTNIDSDNLDDELEDDLPNTPKNLQIIYFGAPGTGKSFKVEHREGETEEDRIRTTFHPDTDYSSFVGCYKPIEVGDEKEKRITYKFEGQCFAKAYVEAWKRLVAREEGQNINFTLIIEEINRGNCAQIFGDIFQLLDRDEKGFSQYGIVPDEDLSKYLSEEFDIIKEELNANGYGKIATGAEMKLPPNLSIIATMNTSDQSLFPIDSAFKRRWDWEYIPIQYTPIDKVTEQPIANKININGTIYDWGNFIKEVNERIYKLTKSEDKELGYFFVRPDDGINITTKRFVSKVIFYLWSDIYKDYAGRENSIFKFSEEDGDEKNRTEHSFNSFFNEEKIKDWLVKKFIEQFVKPIDEEGESSSDAKLKYSINGEEPIGGRRIAVEVMKKYVESYYQQTPQQVVDEWNTLGIKVTHFVETEDEYNSRTDQSLRAQSVEWGDGNKVYVTTHGWVYNTNEQYKVSTIKQLIEAVNAKDWGIKVDIIEQ